MWLIVRLIPVCLLSGAVALADRPAVPVDAHANTPAVIPPSAGETDVSPPSEQPQSPKPAADPEASHELKRPDSTLSEWRERSAAEKQKVLSRGQSSVSPWRVKDLTPLVAVLALIGGAVFLIRRLMPGRGLLAGSGVIQIVARAPIAAKQSLMLVKLGRRLILVGVAPDRMETLNVIDDPEEAAALIGEAASRRPDSMTRAFAEAFDEEVSGYRDDTGQAGIQNRAKAHVRSWLEKMKQRSRSRDVA